MKDEIVQAVLDGATIKVALAKYGVSKQTFKEWLADPEFKARLSSAKAQCEAELLSSVKKAASNGKWQAAVWLLERLVPTKKDTSLKVVRLG